jgi:hypothetical protein
MGMGMGMDEFGMGGGFGGGMRGGRGFGRGGMGGMRGGMGGGMGGGFGGMGDGSMGDGMGMGRGFGGGRGGMRGGMNSNISRGGKSEHFESPFSLSLSSYRPPTRHIILMKIFHKFTLKNDNCWWNDTLYNDK